MEPLTIAISVASFARLDEYAGVWAIEENAARLLAQAAASMDMAAHQAAPPRKVDSTIEKIPIAGGKNIALVRLQGLLMKQQSSMSSSTSTIQARRDIRNAANDAEVSAILLAIDSPGGSMAGTEQLANDIRDARKAKPVYAHIDDLGASAAYFAASQAEKIFASTRSTLVGSIGTMMVVHDYSEAAKKEGVQVHVFKTGALKGLGVPGSELNADHRSHLTQHVHDLQASFDDAVQTGRRLTAEQLAAVKTGAVFPADQAQRLGLIDGIQSLETTIDQLTGRPHSGGKTFTQSAHGGQGAPSMNFEQFCLARGFQVADLNETQRAALQADFDASQRKTPVANPITAPVVGNDGAALMGDIERRMSARQVRLADILEICQEAGNPRVEWNGVTQTVYQHAVKSDLGIDDVKRLCQLGQLRQNAPNVVGIGTGLSGPDSGAIMQAGLEQALGMPNIEQRFSPQILDTAYRQWQGRLGLQELLIRGAQANGYRGSSFRINNGNLKEIIQYAFPRGGPDAPNAPMQAGFSTFSLPGILSNIANKYLLMSFMAVENTYSRIAAERNVSDFKTVTSYRMTGADTFAEVGPDGQLKHATVGEEAYYNQAKTYGRFWSVPRQDIINDDLGALDQKPKRIGRGAALKLLSVFWAAFQANANTGDGYAFWSTQHKNYAAGGGTALQSSALKTFLQKFRDQTDADGDPIAIEPKFLLVPTALEITAWELVKSPKVLGPTDSKAPSDNAFAGRFELLVSAYLSSATAWWLLGDPADIPTIEICYLDGNKTPTVQIVEADADQLGFGYRGFFDFGVAAQDYRASTKAAGA